MQHKSYHHVAVSQLYQNVTAYVVSCKSRAFSNHEAVPVSSITAELRCRTKREEVSLGFVNKHERQAGLGVRCFHVFFFTQYVVHYRRYGC
ncbi:hypothetical protein VFPPC_18136 [Pochonia chlamydosporia 170]|uniref:Uncharacterized protein n=1 Tax=Pochonia chlamydosporia 170 TaxID=1380566 RepID=A0A219APL4_METCM|nr:hypothetical protein VFPPC_18136 [Pochonia chlamydosporia 170]OWT42723.1 hypothetical protein VFPPC_18136 [Pochonia chlamydosporia 170]